MDSVWFLKFRWGVCVLSLNSSDNTPVWSWTRTHTNVREFPQDLRLCQLGHSNRVQVMCVLLCGVTRKLGRKGMNSIRYSADITPNSGGLCCHDPIILYRNYSDPVLRDFSRSLPKNHKLSTNAISLKIKIKPLKNTKVYWTILA